jgi:hypothetical protein
MIRNGSLGSLLESLIKHSDPNPIFTHDNFTEKDIKCIYLDENNRFIVKFYHIDTEIPEKLFTTKGKCIILDIIKKHERPLYSALYGKKVRKKDVKSES